MDVVAKGPYSLGEGALWDSRVGRLYWIDIEGKAFACLEGDDVFQFDLSGMPGTLVLTGNPSEIVLALDSGIVRYDIDSRKETRLLDFPETDDMRFNDGKCDPQGRLWVGSMHRDARGGAGTLYRIDADLSVHPMLGGVTVSNGVCWSADGNTMYFVDSPTREVHAFDFDGRPANRRTAVSVPEGWGFPDGMTIDDEGMLWVAHWNGGCVARYDPDSGEALARFEVPTTKATSCWFGGADLNTLYVTTALGSRDGGWTDTAEHPLSGAVFAFEPGAKGLAATPFKTD